MVVKKKYDMKRFSHIFIILCVALLLLVLTPSHAEAHAQYERSNPSANARLASGSPPASIQVWFTERVEPGFSKLELYDVNRQQVDQNDSRVALNDPRSLIVTPRPGLPDGAYTVVYRAISQEDGHGVKGSFTFVVGGGPLPTSGESVLQEQTSDSFNIWSVVIRWTNYLGLAGLVGGLVFFLLVWRRAVAEPALKIKEGLTLAKRRTEQRIFAQTLFSLVLLIVGWVAFAIYQASNASGEAPWQIFSSGAMLRLLFGSHFGTVWMVRFGLLFVALLLWFYARSLHAADDPVPPLLYWSLLLVGVALMCTTSFNSHAAASHLSWFMIPSDVLHLAGVGFWIGGLLALILVLPVALMSLVPGSGDRTRLLAILIPHFSTVALVSVAVLVITGTIQAFVHLGSLNAFFVDPYGQALALKLGFFLLLLSLGAYSLLKISPLMKMYASSSDEKVGAGSLEAGILQRTFQRSVRLEGVLALALLLVVGGLTSLSPPPQTTSSDSGPLIRQGQMGDLSYRVAISPGKVGDNTIEVELTDSQGKPVQEAKLVRARFIMLDMDMGVQEIELQRVLDKPGHYTITNSVLSMAGQWQVTLLVRRDGFDDVRGTFEFPLQLEGSEKYP